MEIKNKKFIVTSGCSYGVAADYVFNIENILYDKKIMKDFGKNWIETDYQIVVLNLSCGSQGSDWACDSVIHTCNKLLELGVPNENIYVLVEWSQWHRYTVSQHHYTGTDFSELKWTGEGYKPFNFYEINPNNNSEKSQTICDFFRKHLNLEKSTILNNIAKINDRIYITPSHVNKNMFSEISYPLKFYIENCRKIEDTVPIESKIKIYLDNILRLQYFLKSENIRYNFFFMQLTLSNWDKLEDGTILDPFKNLYYCMDTFGDSIVINNNYNPKSDCNKRLEIVLNETNNEISKLDFKNIWFYQNEKYDRGGIDEYTIDNFREGGYLNITHNFNFDIKGSITYKDIIVRHNEHPNLISYLTLWNQVTQNCDFMKLNEDFVNFMVEKYWEDYHSENETVNNITISKKHWYKLTGIEYGFCKIFD